MRALANKKRVRYGFMMAIFCAIFWGIWYVPGTFIWNFDIITEFQDVANGIFHSDYNGGFLSAAILITALNCAFVMFSYFIWNLCLGKAKFSEMKRSVLELRNCTKYYFLGAVCGGPIAILGSFIAMGYIGGAFAAVAALAYPVIGTLLSRVWLKQKISHRAIAGVIIILIGSITIYAIGMIEDLINAGGSPIGYIGGLMALCGWGIEGAIAARGIDVSEPDIAITMRFGMESLIWFLIMLPALAILSIPVYEYAWAMITDPIILLTLIMLGLTFGFCYVAWYKAFPLIGVGRGQAIGSLYALMGVIFLIMFIGVTDAIGEEWTRAASLVIGAVLCTIGTIVMFTEKTEEVATLREVEETSGDERP
jgi:drug/metabolite transporter (DMT)-like permease